MWQAKYNPYHDSLLLSASSDSLVNLWHTPTTAGASSLKGQGTPKGPSQTGQKGFGKEAHDGKSCTYDDHEDSVYGKHAHSVPDLMSRDSLQPSPSKLINEENRTRTLCHMDPTELFWISQSLYGSHRAYMDPTEQWFVS